MQRYNDLSLKHYVDLHSDEYSWCPTADCTYAFVMDEEEAKKGFECPLCSKVYCMVCRVEFHKGQSCREYQISHSRDKNDEKFEKFIKGKKFKQCAKCKFWVEKNQGCDHMTCRCGYEFCYKCGGKYRQCECMRKQKEQAEARIRRIQEQRERTNENKRKRRR
eukprot:TRINITY_DN7017_c0_g1_i11.p1 TRINITY_DN7017_c0_g1~~TRINITY_DN7017_c0_g1_i11.p1  ORF type:complete len:163 (+),score=22.59 TRINITY_DN7017_c0_g1_i11:184-672(+)